MGPCSFQLLAAGSHTLLLGGIAGNCSLDGQNPRTITAIAEETVPDLFQVACIAPAAREIAFVRALNGSRDIFTMNRDGSDQVNLTNDAIPDDFPRWSPDGTRIAFTSQRVSVLPVTFSS